MNFFFLLIKNAVEFPLQANRSSMEGHLLGSEAVCMFTKEQDHNRFANYM